MEDAGYGYHVPLAFEVNLTRNDQHLEVSIKHPTWYMGHQLTRLRLTSFSGLTLQSGPVSKDGRYHACILSGRIQQDGEYRFSIHLYSGNVAENNECVTFNEPAVCPIHPHHTKVVTRMMKNIETMDMAFTFGVHGGARNVGLWVHQEILAQQPALASLIDKLKIVEGSPTDSNVVAGIKSHHVTDYSLETYCCLVRFVYTGEINLYVNLNDFAIGCPPNKPISIACKNRPAIEGLFSTTDTITSSDSTHRVQSSTSARASSYGELFQLADCFDVKALRDHCRSKIISSLESANALETLFGYAHRYEDLKNEVLDVVIESLDKIFIGDHDPFEPYADHP
ncbi:hypothetical protein BG000_001199 [Podila horticola]|nr:hypothetical protein BG000_001199 [Podila horticola]